MRSPIKFSLLILLALPVSVLKAQQFGGNPPSLKWRQVNTPAARVIFPVGMDSTGLRVANIIMQMNSRIQPTIGTKQRQVSILLQNQTTQSNGYVGLAPFRSEFFLTPDQNTFELGSLRWADQLAVHEFRHVQQYNNFNVGLSHIAKVIFGEGGQVSANEIAVPNWFFEGDAVFNETLVTDQGRGRLPYFFNGYRALWAAGKNYSYMKLRNGSYRDFVPDWYPLGYMLVSYGREKYGDDFWKNVTHDAASLYHFYPMQSAIKRYSGVNFNQFQANAFDHYKQQFINDMYTGSLTEPDKNNHIPVSDRHKHFIANQEYPAYVDDNTIIYSKATYDKPAMFVMNTNGKEQKIAGRNFSIDTYFDYHDGKIIYASYRPDIRWTSRDYSELTLVDVKTGHETRITKNSKYFSPSISNDGSRVVAVKVSADGSNQLCILDINGKLIAAVPNKNNLFFTYPKLYGDKIITPVRRGDGCMSIASVDISGNVAYLLDFRIQPIAFPSVHGDKVYFSATEDKNDGLFALSLTDRKLYRLQNSTIKGDVGNYQPTASANKLAWVSFTAYGFELHQASNNDVKWEEITTKTDVPTEQSSTNAAIPGSLSNFGIKAVNKGNTANMLAKVNNNTLAVTKYNKAFHLLNFHTLQPDFESPNYTVTLQGNNVLNTMITNLSYNYNSNEGYSEYGLSAVYGAWFPYLSAGADYINGREAYSSKYGVVNYNQAQIHGGFEIPLTLTRGRAATSLYFGSDVVYSRNYFSGIFDVPSNNHELVYLNNYLGFSTRSRTAKKNIYPSLGLNFNVNYKSAINGVNANQLLLTGTAFLPGILANHSLVLGAAYHERDSYNNANYSNDFTFARGYTAANLYQISKLSADYHFPIAYPDFGIINAAYLSRIRANVFYDYSYGCDPYVFNIKINNDFSSTGAQLTFDGKLWNFFDYSIAFRYSHLLNANIFGPRQSDKFEIVLPISFF